VTRADLQKLSLVADALKEAELGRLSALARERRRIEEQIARIADAQARALAQAGPDPAHLSGADARWEAWAGAQRRTLLTQAAQAAAETEAQRTAASRSFGRAQVLETLAKHAKTGKR
jgi:hypothetical protein